VPPMAPARAPNLVAGARSSWLSRMAPWRRHPVSRRKPEDEIVEFGIPRVGEKGEVACSSWSALSAVRRDGGRSGRATWVAGL
jgi:hypothetical protein